MGWCGLIAGTSSRVISPHDYFAWLGTHVFKDDAVLRRFVVFWGYGWFAVVKGWHVAEFAILFTLSHATLGRLSGPARRRNLALAAGFCLAFALSDEYHQTFVPGRGGRWSDVAIDGLGVVLAGTVVWRRGEPAGPAS